MKTLFFFLLFCPAIFSQTINGYVLNSDKTYQSYYNTGFNLYDMCLYYVWQDNNTRNTIVMAEDQGGILVLKSYVPQSSGQIVTTYQITIEGWYDDALNYTKSLTDINQLNVSDINYNIINRIVVKMTGINPLDLTNFNFDGFILIYGTRITKSKL